MVRLTLSLRLTIYEVQVNHTFRKKHFRTTFLYDLLVILKQTELLEVNNGVLLAPKGLILAVLSGNLFGNLYRFILKRHA